MTSRPTRIAFAALILLGAGGCAAAWRAPASRVNWSVRDREMSLADHLPPVNTVSVFKRSDLNRPAAPTLEYPTVRRVAGREEGVLFGMPWFPLDRFFVVDGEKPSDAVQWPDPPDSSGAAFFLEFDPPLVQYPDALKAGQPVQQLCRARYLTRSGRQLFSGNIERTILLEGLDRILVQNRGRRRCLRVRIETKWTIPLLVSMKTVDLVWLAPKLGEVRRIQHWQGMVTVFSVDEAFRFDLLNTEAAEALLAAYSPQRPEARPVADNESPGNEDKSEDELVVDESDIAEGQTEAAASSAVASDLDPEKAAEAWKRCAVFVQPKLPRPQLAGLAAEFSSGGALHQEGRRTTATAPAEGEDPGSN